MTGSSPAVFEATQPVGKICAGILHFRRLEVALILNTLLMEWLSQVDDSSRA